MTINGVTLELYNQDDADRFVVVFDRFGTILDRFGVVVNRFSAVFDSFGSVFDGFGAVFDRKQPQQRLFRSIRCRFRSLVFGIAVLKPLFRLF